jgi:halimadienyl-diphosphate synthase
MDLKRKAKELTKNISGRLEPSAYDAAWMARVPADGTEEPRWPELIDWLLSHQWLDGSWGGTIRYYHDRIISTLAAIIALKERGSDPQIEEAINRGERYIWHNLHRLHNDPFELVGFELILPTLLTEAVKMGLDIPLHTCGYGRIRAKKLSLIPSPLLYSPQVTTVHSLEFLGKDVKLERMRQSMAINGSIGNSPATTSYYLLMEGNDNRALSYLQDMLEYNDQQVVYLYPCRTFQLTWALHSLSFCNEPLVNLVDASVWEELRSSISERGIGLDPTFGIEDGDITSVSIRLMTLAGYSMDPAILARFEDKERRLFRTYEYERNIGVSTNVHALEAVSLLPEYPNKREVQDRILALLMGNRVFDTYWVDKWHASPYYVTAHALVGILATAPELIGECFQTVQWVAHTQREDGSWGFFDRGTVEETAYSLVALLHFYRRRPSDVNREILKKAASFLYQEYEKSGNRHPELYIGKCLFTPRDVVHASTLAAMILYEETFGWPLA